MAVTLEHLRSFAVERSLFSPTTLPRAIEHLGFVQADPIRAPARAQDLTLRHRVSGYRAGDLERRYASLAIEEDFFVNYGFLPRRSSDLMLPRSSRRVWSAAERKQVDRILAFVHEGGSRHPSEVAAHFATKTVTNYWGGSSNATTHLLDAMHHRGLLRVVRREGGIRIYAPRVFTETALSPEERAEALLGIALKKYAPLPGATLVRLTRMLRSAIPHLAKYTSDALNRARTSLPHARIDEVDWYWPADEEPSKVKPAPDHVYLLAPFDPIVWDRHRFELFWNWEYRFEAYTPAKKRKLGYYALPLLWRANVIGWANVVTTNGQLDIDIGYVTGAPPKELSYKRELEAEIERLRGFLDRV
jgi:uncharacterized protein